MSTDASDGASPPVFHRAFTITAADIDMLGHVNNVAWLAHVQAMAEAHWRAVAPPALAAQYVWVVTRHEIDYFAPAHEGDRIEARTWVGAAQGATYERHVEFRRAGEPRVLVAARTLWCPIDAATRRPRRVSAELRAPFEAARP